MCAGHPDACPVGESSQAPGGSVPVHPGAATAEQDGPAAAGTGCTVDGPADCWRQRDEDDLGAFATDAQDTVAVLADVFDVWARSLEGPSRPSTPSMATSAKS
jgi:hypothetical protein